MSLRETALAAGTPDARRLRLHVPPGPPPRQGWPLLVLLDGNWVWPLQPTPADLTNCAVLIPGHGGRHGPMQPWRGRTGTPSGAGAEVQALARRALDFTPPAPDGSRWPDPRRPEWECGGADPYLDMLLGTMLDWAHTQTALDPARMSLYGHSYGGLCALYALARHPGRFSHTICASPSLWWYDGYIETLLDRLPRTLPADLPSSRRPLGPRPIRLTLMAGTDERWYARPADPAIPRRPSDGIPTLPRLESLCDRLAHVPWLGCALERLEGVQHGDALQASARRAVALAVSP